MMHAPLPERLRDFVRDSRAGSFDELAAAAFAFQYERIPAYRALCDRRGVRPGSLTDWQAIPAVPTAAYKSLELAAAPAVEVFRSSGTGGERSVHQHGFPDLYRATIEASFPRHCLPAASPVSILSLVPSRELAPDSSLSFMIDHVLTRFGAPSSAVGLGPRGVELGKVRSWLNGAQRGARPVLIVATAFSLLDLLDTLARIDLRFRLPAGSVVFETGGFKGRTRETTREELLALTAERLGLPGTAVVREYGMTELTSQCYTEAILGGDPDLFVAPHWVRVRALDPENLAPVPAGRPGLIAVLDLANLSSAIHVLTQDLGVMEGVGFRLLGRAAGAELRGCSLTVEELTQDASPHGA